MGMHPLPMDRLGVTGGGGHGHAAPTRVPVTVGDSAREHELWVMTHNSWVMGHDGWLSDTCAPH